MKSARVTVAVAAVLAGATLAGCSTATSSATTTGDVSSMPIITGLETTHLVVQDFPAIDSSGLYIAASDGLFAKEGLQVTVVPDFASSQDTVNLIESGQAQISSGDYVTYMNDLTGLAGAKDENLEIVAEGSVLQPHVLSLMISGRSKITSLKQLKGQKIPISGPNDIGSLLIDSVLADNHVPINSVHYVPGQNLAQVPFKIAAGVFPAGPVPEPFVSIGEQQAGDQVLADLDQGATTNFPIQGYAVTRQWAAANPNTLKAFTTALEYGQETADTERAKLQSAIEAKPLSVPVSVASVISVPQFPLGVEPTRLERVLDDMIEFDFFQTDPAALKKAEKLSTALKSVVYAANLATSSGESGLLGGG